MVDLDRMAVGMDVDVAAGVESRKYAPMSKGSARSAVLGTGGVVRIAGTVRMSRTTMRISRSRQLRKNCCPGEDAGWYGQRRAYFGEKELEKLQRKLDGPKKTAKHIEAKQIGSTENPNVSSQRMQNRWSGKIASECEKKL